MLLRDGDGLWEEILFVVVSLAIWYVIAIAWKQCVKALHAISSSSSILFSSTGRVNASTSVLRRAIKTNDNPDHSDLEIGPFLAYTTALIL